MKKKWNREKKQYAKKEYNKNDHSTIFFECKNLGHVKSECPRLEKRWKKGKGVKDSTATGSETKDSNSDEESKN